MADKDENLGRPVDDFGVGMNDDGTLNVVPPDQVQARLAQIKREEDMDFDEYVEHLKSQGME